MHILLVRWQLLRRIVCDSPTEYNYINGCFLSEDGLKFKGLGGNKNVESYGEFG